MGALIATIFTVIVVAVSSVFVSNQLSFQQSVAPNAPSSKPLAASCAGTCRQNCNEDEKGSGTCDDGQHCCISNSNPNPTTGSCDNSTTTNSLCRGLSVGSIVNCNHKDGTALKCTRTSGTACSAVSGASCTKTESSPTPTSAPLPTTSLKCFCPGSCSSGGCWKGSSGSNECNMKYCEGWKPTPTKSPTPTKTPTSTPTKSPSPTSSCYCSHGKLTGSCGASLGQACSTDTTPTPTKSPTPTCECKNGIYVGSGCGHSSGLSCSQEEKKCDDIVCNASCAKTSGYTGYCLSNYCMCVKATPTPTPSSKECNALQKLLCGSKTCIIVNNERQCLSPTPTSTPSPTPKSSREEQLCVRDGGTWDIDRCVYPFLTPKPSQGATPTPTPIPITLPLPRSLDNYNHPGDSETFANVTNNVASLLYTCQQAGNLSGIALRNCFCNTVNCNTNSGNLLADKLFTLSSDGNGLQCVEFVNTLEALQKNGSTNNCDGHGVTNASEMISCNEPGYTRCPGGSSQSNFKDGDLVVWAKGGVGSKEGHVAVCVKASSDGKSCTIAESNWNGDKKVGFRTISTIGKTDENNYNVVLRRTPQNNQTCN